MEVLVGAYTSARVERMNNFFLLLLWCGVLMVEVLKGVRAIDLTEGDGLARAMEFSDPGCRVTVAGRG